jgi:hypothetical protein
MPVKARIFFVALLVAAWTRITPRPPHRSRRAPLTHRAPPSGFGVEAVTGQRVECLDWRKEAIDEADEALPGEVSLLVRRRSEEPRTRLQKPPDARVVFVTLRLHHAALGRCRSRGLLRKGIDMKFAFIAKHRGISLLKPPFRGGLNHPRRETAVKATFGRFGLIRFHD